jgi:hypothetical protein
VLLGLGKVHFGSELIARLDGSSVWSGEWPLDQLTSLLESPISYLMCPFGISPVFAVGNPVKTLVLCGINP